MHPQSPALTIGGTVLKESDDLVILGVTFDSKMTFEKHLRSVSRAASQRLGILRKSWQVFHDRLLPGRCFRGCGTCHMAFLFMPLPRAATSTNCSTNVLLNTFHHATSCTATTLWSSSHNLHPSARSHLSDPFSINNLLSLSPKRLGMNIYLVNQITSAPLTSNNIICDSTFMRLSKLLSSPMG